MIENNPKVKRAVSIHTPREGGDGTLSGKKNRSIRFNPHPPRGGRHKMDFLKVDEAGVSIHTPREGGDASVTTCRSPV